MLKVLFLCLSLFVVSCASKTKFTGEAHLTPALCEAKCSSWQMELQGMVAMGEYSDACICKKKSVTKVDSPASMKLNDDVITDPVDEDEDEVIEDVGTEPVGVLLQMRNDEETQQQNSQGAFMMSITH